MIDYSVFYRRSINPERMEREVSRHDYFISAYNSSERVRNVYNRVLADKKIWVIHPEYRYSPIEYPPGDIVVAPEQSSEIEQANLVIEQLDLDTGCSICIDITGFMRHVLIFLIGKLHYLGVRSLSVIYSEPKYYIKQEDTAFSTETSGLPRPVYGMSGSNQSLPQSKDFLVVGVGYDHKLISEVVEHKDNAIVYPLFSFPSLSPDMYQQSAIRSADSGPASLGNSWVVNRLFAPANDPFAIAEVVSELVHNIDRQAGGANIYLSPLSTKVQAVGFTLYWILEGRHRDSVTVLLPECITYTRETSRGLKRLWLYSLELF
ncbi:hypothetical protein [Alloalcanivorax xenomutans]|uniref:hypothetical protein n=1 Tax=Alloalcanivorax xenomutans TaxID=1094342 RepID=UPI003C469BB2